MKHTTSQTQRVFWSRILLAFGVIVGSALAGSLSLALASQQGPSYATSLGLQQLWTHNADALGTPDNTCAVQTPANQSIDLKGFNFNLPPTATINGIIVEPKFAAQKDTTALRAQLLKSTLPTGSTKSFIRSSSATDKCDTSVYMTLGNSADLWGAMWTPTDVNSSNFGVRFTTLAPGDANAYIDAVRITVNYTESDSVMSVTIMSGGSLTATVGRADIESGKVEFLSQTTLKAISTTKNWCVRATASVLSTPAGAENPTANAVEIKNYLGVFTPAGVSGGVIVAMGEPTSSNGLNITVDLRVMLPLLGDGKVGAYQFIDEYTILENIGANCI